MALLYIFSIVATELADYEKEIFEYFTTIVEYLAKNLNIQVSYFHVNEKMYPCMKEQGKF